MYVLDARSHVANLSTGTKLLRLPPFVCQKFSSGLQYAIYGLEGTPRPKAALL